jgi:superfamily II DNA or RNA helicase
MLDITWSPPYTVREGFVTKWRREWCIPPAMLSGFFSFWKPNRFKMLADGFTVIKSEKTGKWYLYETKDNVALFKIFGNTPTKSKPDDKFVLPTYTIKDKSGLRPWQVDAAGRLCSAINHWGSAIDGSDTGCHSKGQLILMANGTTKAVEHIVVGDEVMGWKGPQQVTELKRGRQKMVKICPVKGDPFVVNLDHILTVVLTNGCSPSHKKTSGYEYGSIVDIRVKDYLTLPPATKHAMKLFSTHIECWNNVRTPYSAYFIGLLLGDGGLSSCSTVSITSQSKEIWDAVKRECEYNKWTLGNTKEDITKRITSAPDLFSWLRSEGLLPVACENKKIPQSYKTGIVNQRMHLLAGLLDTDGYYQPRSNGYEIILKSKQLSEDIVFVARSLGLAAYTKQCRKKCYNNGVIGTYYRTNISGNVDIIPCRIPYKQARKRQQKKNVLHRGFKVELMGEDDYYGFSLSGDGRFFLGDFTITHNTGKTYTACAVARELGLKICVVCPKAVIKSWNKVIKKHFKMESSLIGVVNYEKLRNGRKDSPVASYVLHRHKKRPTFEWKLPAKTLIIWDESHKLKNWKTKNSKTCQAAIKAGYPMLFCSATNATNPLEMRAVGLALKLFNNSNSYYTWATENGVYKGNWGLEFNDDPKILKRLNKQIFDQRGVRLRRDDIPNFPKCEVIAEVYNMEEEDTLKINETYSEMERELAKLSKIEKKDPTMEAVIQLRMRQKVELIKVPLFVEMIEEAIEEGFSVVVFVNFTDTLIAIAQRLKTACIFDGKTSDKAREKNVELFQEDKERIILVNIQSGGAGLSLHDLNGKFPRMSIISPTFSPIFMRQTLGRIWRDDSKTKSIQRIVCVANTVEEDVCRNVQQKLNNLDLLNDGDLMYSKKYLNEDI